METPTASIFWAILIACIGGGIVLVGIVLEVFSEKTKFKNIRSFRRWGCTKHVGEWFVIAGIAIETGVAGWSAKNEWDARQMAIKNSPANQPVSEMYAILRLEINATNYDTNNPLSLETLNASSLNCGPFRLLPKDGRRFIHVDNYMTGHINYYGFAVRYENDVLPSSEWNDINNTNSYDFTTPSMTFSSALTNLTPLYAYLDFIPKNAQLVKCSARIVINGHRLDFQIGTNSVSKQFSDWNPEKPGMFLIVSNLTPSKTSVGSP